MNSRTLTEDETNSLIMGVSLLIDLHQSKLFEADQRAHDQHASEAEKDEAKTTVDYEESRIAELKALYEALYTESLTITTKTTV